MYEIYITSSCACTAERMMTKINQYQHVILLCFQWFIIEKSTVHLLLQVVYTMQYNAYNAIQ